MRCAILSTALFLAAASCWSASTSTIAAHSPTAATTETFLLCGDFYGTDTVSVGDKTTTAAATILQQDTQTILATVPNGISTGTLWVWIADGANSVTLNNPEPWWIQPDRFDIGDTVRIFGRNLAAGTSPTATVLMESMTTGTQFQYTATVLNPHAIQLTVGATDALGASVFHDSYYWWVDEPKVGGVAADYAPTLAPSGNPSSFTLRAAYSHPATTASVTTYGAVPNDSNADTTAIKTAMDTLYSSGGGTLIFPAGRFIFDESQAAAGHCLRVPVGVRLQGNGIDSTYLDAEPTAYLGHNWVLIGFQDNAAATSMTIRGSGAWVASQRLVYLSGEGSYIQYVKVDADGMTSSCLSIPVNAIDYSSVLDSQIYGPRSMTAQGDQIRISNVTWYGSKDTSQYDDISNTSSLGSVLSTTGCNGMIVENCTVRPREGPYRRFFGGNSSNDQVWHIYMEGCDTLLKSTPWSNEGENVLFETRYLGQYRGQATVDPSSPTILNLSSTMTTGAVTRLVAVTQGDGLGQYRLGRILTTSSIQVSEAFTVEPNLASTISVGYGVFRTIFYDNDFRSTSPYPLAGYGVAYYGTSIDGCVTSNSFIGWKIAYGQAVFSADSTQQTVCYWHNVTDNVCSGNLVGMITYPLGTDAAVLSNLGHTYRGNTIYNAHACPQYGSDILYVAFGIAGNVGGGYTTGTYIHGDIYENNTVSNCRRGFYAAPLADAIVVRNNSFTDCFVASNYNDATVTVHHSGNSSNTLPWIDIGSTTSIPYITAFEDYTNIADWDDMCMWGDVSGSATLTITDADGDATTVTALSGATAVATATVTNYLIEWSGLTEGLNTISVSASDGIATTTREIKLFAGGTFEDFENVSALTQDGSGNWSITTAVGSYLTTTVSILYTPVHSHTPSTQTSTIHGGVRLQIMPVNEEIRMGMASPTAIPRTRAVLSFVRKFYTSADSYMRARLIQDSNNYYEFYDFAGYDDDFMLRTLRKVSGGTEQWARQRVATHMSESPVTIELNNQTVRALGWGDELSMTDSSPLAIETWELHVASQPTTNAYQQSWAWSTVDNLFFAATGAAGSGSSVTVVVSNPTSLSAFAHYQRLAWTVASDANGSYNEQSTRTITGRIRAIEVIPGTGGTQPDNNFVVALFDGSTNLISGSGQCSNTSTTRLTPRIDAEHGLRTVTGSALTLSITGMGASNTATVRIYFT